MGEGQGGLSLKPSDATSGGGLLDDANVTIVSARAALWDYNGNIPTPVVAMAVTMQPDADADGNQGPNIIQYYSAGDPKNFVPSADGHRFVPVGSASGLNEGCNAMAFIVSMLNAVNGFPVDKLEDDLGVFDGVRAYVKRVPAPVRAGIAKKADSKGDGKILLVQKILSFPWDTASAAPKAKKTPVAPKVNQTPQAQPVPLGAAAGAPTPVAEGLNDEAVSVMMGLLADKGGTITKAQIAQEAFKVLKTHPNRNELMKVLYADAFLSAGPWQFDGTTVSLG